MVNNLKINFKEFVQMKHEKQNEQNYLIIVVGKSDLSLQLDTIQSVLSNNGWSIEKKTSSVVQGLSGEKLYYGKFLIRFSVVGVKEQENNLKRYLENIEDVDIFFFNSQQIQVKYKLIAFDMDSTFITVEVIDQLAKYAGVGEKVSVITNRSMKGELDFTNSLKERVACLKGLDVKILQKIADHLELSDGVKDVLSAVKSNGLICGLLSGGFSFFSQFLKDKYQLDFAYSNELEVKNGRLTGRVIGDIVCAQKKKELLDKLGSKNGIVLNEMIAVGDGANDLPMLKAAGVGVAFRAKPIVKAQAEFVIQTAGLEALQLFIKPMEGMN